MLNFDFYLCFMKIWNLLYQCLVWRRSYFFMSVTFISPLNIFFPNIHTIILQFGCCLIAFGGFIDLRKQVYFVSIFQVIFICIGKRLAADAADARSFPFLYSPVRFAVTYNILPYLNDMLISFKMSFILRLNLLPFHASFPHQLLLQITLKVCRLWKYLWVKIIFISLDFGETLLW